jgi:hypothetical protein
MKKLILFGVLAAFLTLPSIGQATDGSSGCGPGWYILKDDSLVSSALRVITNDFLFPVSTLGMTSGTSNCTQHKIVLKEKESLHFATMNYHELKAESARGEGIYLSAFSDTIGCGKAHRADFSRKVQSNFGKVFSNGKQEPAQMLEEVYKVILQDPTLIQSCSLG